MMPASVLLMLGEGTGSDGSGSERARRGKKEEGGPYVNIVDGSNIVNTASKQL